MRRVARRAASGVAAATLCLGGLGSLTACGDDEPAPSTTDDDTAMIEITFSEGTVEPSGDRVEVGVDQPIELVVRADAPGSIHVHTKPDDQEFEYSEGTTTLPLTVDKPGLVEVESHDLEKVIVQLEVR